MSNPTPAEIFQAEAQDLLEQIEQGLLDLESDPENGELIASVFRALHTLKGSGAMFGFAALASFVHHCETAFDRVRKGEARATPKLISAVLSALDHMRDLASGGEAVPEREAALLADLQEEGMPSEAAAVEASVPPPVPDPCDSAAPADAAGAQSRLWHVRFKLPVDAMVNGTRPLSLLDELRGLGEAKVSCITDSVPELDALQPNECHLIWDVLLKTTRPKSDIEDVFIFVMDDMTLDIEDVTGVEAGAADAGAANSAAALPEAPPPESDVAQTTDDLGATAVAAANAPEPTAGAVEKTSGESPVAAPQKKSGRPNQNVGSLRVPAERLDELMDRVAELVIAQSRLKQVAAGSIDANLRTVAEEIERLASELRDSMMLVRMVPIAQLFGRFRRLTRDLASETGKDIEFKTLGETTELDKTVIERLADPMIHLIRNSADHGLETAEERRAAGKRETGRILLSAHQAGTEVVIAVSDDGKGINREKVREKAVKNGLISADVTLSDKDLLQLIFQPGFSTAAKVTDLSGRGVGMDVVKRTVESLRGSIEVSSEPGQGTTVALRIPLTLAIIDGLLVRVGTNRYVIPLSAVEECVELSREQDLRSAGRSFLTLRDALVPFLRLRELFGTGTDPDPYQKIVVVSTGADRVGLVVDQILGQHQTVIKPMSRLHADVETFSGATILGDGSVALILDIAHLVATGQLDEARLRAAS